jgi:zinc D-Ala-D-Ala carboxypeptidase
VYRGFPVRLRVLLGSRAIVVAAIAATSISSWSPPPASAGVEAGRVEATAADPETAATAQAAAPAAQAAATAQAAAPAAQAAAPAAQAAAPAAQAAASAAQATTAEPLAAAAPTGSQPATTPLGLLVTNGDPLPACAYSSIATPITNQSQFGLTLMDTTYGTTSAYVPAGLVQATASGIRSRELVRSIVIPDLKRMAAAATAAGASLAIVSAYRSYQNQVVTFRHWQNLQGYAKALISSARPGHSEHQLGTAIDFKSRAGPLPWLMTDWAKQSAAGIWLAANAWKYGFIMSYPRGQIGITCYEYEPWHYRYVGVAEAAAVHASGLTLRQWIWEHQPNPELPSP